MFADGAHEWIENGEDSGIVAFVRRVDGMAVLVTANLSGKDAAFVPEGSTLKVGVSAILSERFSVGPGGECRFGPWGYAVLSVE